MKKIINGKVYDTDTAKFCGEDSYSERNDFHHWTETLYQKRTGEFFLYGEGGPLTQYARAVGQNSWTGGERIMPMSYSEATKWAEKHLSADEYEAIFGEVAEDETEAALNVRIPTALFERLRRVAAQRGVSQRDVIIELLKCL